MDTIRRHHIRLKAMPPEKDAGVWLEGLKRVEGVKSTVLDAAGLDVFVEYDLLACREEDIEREMRELGFVLDEGFLERLKRGWVHFIEENERDAMRAGVPCCDYDMDKKRRELG